LPVCSKMTEVHTGRAGELLAAGIIEAHGFKTVLCQQTSFDMLLMRSDDTHYRVEVKTTAKAVSDPRRKTEKPSKYYCWSTARGSGSKKRLDPSAVDLLVLVALDTRRCIFRPVHGHDVLRFNYSKSKMLELDENQMLTDALNRIDERR
jgi:Holliday junction resolvase-like predicted endonuclease